METYTIQKFSLPALSAFDFQIMHGDTDRRTHSLEVDTHTHSEFEIYINLTGDMSFLVENSLYPLTRGDVILARPGELHHCVYHSDAKHRYFWLLIDCHQNEQALDSLFRRPDCHFVSLPQKEKEELIALCHRLMESELEDTIRFSLFFRLLALLVEGADKPGSPSQGLPEDLTRMLAYIQAHLADPIQVADMAADLYISESTINRRFREHLGLSALEFIRKRKLHLAADLLAHGESVLNAGLRAGYGDNSYFIRLFRQQYGMTPLQYKQAQKKRRN